MYKIPKTNYSVEEIRNKMQRVTRSDGSMVTFFEDSSGSICSTVYEPFPGVGLVQKDVHMPQFITNWRYGVVSGFAIEYCREGRLECQVDDDYLYIMPGDIIIFRTDPNIRIMNYPSSHYHATSFVIFLDEPSPVLDFHLEMAGFTTEMLMEKYLPNGRYYSLLKKNDLLINVFETISRVPETMKKTLYGHKILETLILLASELTEINERHIHRIPKHQADMAKEVYNYVMLHPEKRFSIDQLSKKFSISPTQLKKYFQIAYGTSMQKFIREQKIKAAAKVLESTGKSVTEVAQMFGYSNISKFSEAFQSIIGEYPKEYRLHYYTVQKDEIENV